MTTLPARTVAQTFGQIRLCVLVLMCALLGSTLAAQTASPAATQPTTAQAPTAGQSSTTGEAGGQAAPAPPAPATTNAAAQTPEKNAKAPRSSDRRKAAKLYLESSKLFVNSQFEQAMKGFEQASNLDPTNNDYRMAAQVARSHLVMALIQAAAKDKLTDNDAGARAALERALELDPKNIEATQHLFELADDAVRGESKPLYERDGGNLGEQPELLAATERHSFHLHTDTRQTIEQVFQVYGIKAMLDDSVRAGPARLDLDNVTFEEAANAVSMLTNSFYVPLDAHHVLVARDTRENRQRLIREELETVYLTGLTDAEIKDVGTLAKNVFGMTQAQTSASAITVRAPASTLNAFNATMQGLMDGRSQVVLDVKLIQVQYMTTRNTGVQLPQTFTVFNVPAEVNSILSQNQALVQQIISSGLASPNDPLAILGILIASGQVSSSLLSNGFAVFGGGLTQTAISMAPLTLNLNLNTSESRELDDTQLRLQDGEQGTLKEGERYPIQTSSYSSLSPTLPNIPGLTGVGSSSALSSLLSSASSVPNIPMVQYQDLGLTLTATPSVMRDGDVALSVEMKLDALSGASIDGNPVLDSRAYKGVVTLKEGEAVVVATEMDKSESQSVSGTPGLSEIPGMNDATSKEVQKNYATLVIVMTPHVVRGPQAAGHTAMMRVEKSGSAQ
jgi:general secretion pathway protein D